jgi:hypothetical protein
MWEERVRILKEGNESSAELPKELERWRERATIAEEQFKTLRTEKSIDHQDREELEDESRRLQVENDKLTNRAKEAVSSSLFE